MFEIGGQRYSVLTRRGSAGAGHPTASQVAAALAEVPRVSRRLIKEVRVKSGRGLLGRLSSLTTARASVGGRVDVLAEMLAVNAIGSTVGDQLRRALIHESGHLLAPRALGRLQREGLLGWLDRTLLVATTLGRWAKPGRAWREAMKEDGAESTSYGATSATEDFAESWVLYNEHPEQRARLPHRFEHLDRVVREAN